MYNLSDPVTIKRILKRYGTSAAKALGQNFLADPSVCPMMAESAGVDEKTGVIEVGPGIGILTAELAKKANKVIAVEIDKNLLPVLKDTLSGFDNIEIINGDILKTDINKIIEEKLRGLNVVVCANLPYYITSPVLMYLLENRFEIGNITVMVQNEAARRLCAGVGSRDSGAVTVAVRFYSNPRLVFDVGREAFVPSPNVDSSVIRLDIRSEPPIQVDDQAYFFRMVKAGFSQRRKTALNALSAGLNLEKKRVRDALIKSELDLNVRMENLTMEELRRLYCSLR